MNTKQEQIKNQLNKDLLKKLKKLLLVGHGMAAILEALIYLVNETIQDAEPGPDRNAQVKLRDNLNRTLQEYKRDTAEG